jgi:eukaryotic-like serine/threonine-protein kinase
MKKYTFLLLLFLLGSILLSSCGGTISATSWPGLTLNEDTAYVAYLTGVYAVRMNDGQLIWRYPAEANKSLSFYAAPMIAGDQLVVGDYSKTLHSLDIQNGTEKWSFAQAGNRWIANVTTSGDNILAPNSDKSLYALTFQGQMRWEYETNHALWGAPVTDGSTVYQASMDHFLYALDMANGNLIWKTDLGGAAVYGPALAENGSLYVSTLGNEVVAVNGSDGSVEWRFKANDQVWGTPTLHEDSILIGDLSGTIYAINTQDGSQLWSLDAGGPVFGSGAVTPEGVVFNTENGNVVLVSFSGEKVWTQTIVGKLYTTPAYGNDLIVIAVTGGENLLVGLTLQGTQKWTFAPPE